MYLSIIGSSASPESHADFDAAVEIAGPRVGGLSLGPGDSIGQAVDATEEQAEQCMAFAAKTKTVKVSKRKK